MKYFTMVEMAKIIGIPESSARGYRDRFPEYMSVVGEGRSKRYTQEALEALRIVATTSREGMPFEEIKTALEDRFGVMIDSQSQTVVSQPQNVADENFKLVETVVRELNSELNAMREQMTALQAQLESRDESRDKQLVAVLREIQEMRQEARRPWWKKIFRS